MKLRNHIIYTTHAFSGFGLLSAERRHIIFAAFSVFGLVNGLLLYVSYCIFFPGFGLLSGLSSSSSSSSS